MPKRITIAPHVSVEELEKRYRQAKDPLERSDYQIIWLLAQGRRTEEVAAITGYSRSWIYELVWGYNRVGSETLVQVGIRTQGPSLYLMMCSKLFCCRR
jgi:DNA-binding response OmpR family regulator